LAPLYRNTFCLEAARDHGEKRMQIQEQTTETNQERPMHVTFLSPTILNVNFSNPVETNVLIPEFPDPTPRLFEHIARTTLAERFPLLTCFAISCALLATALITEIECLKGSGYFWR
jgi:hypothetical protein